ncbi:MAG: MBL fold metallo-hydrolase [Nostocoides sp.]
MTAAPPDRAEAPWSSGPVTPRTTCVLAPNPGPMTLDGTNTWLVAEPGSDQAIIIDPGPLDENHLGAVLDAASDRGVRVGLIVLTHAHLDHSEGASRCVELTGAPVRAVGRGHDDLGDGDVLRLGGLEVAVVATPGHSSDSISFALPADHVLLTGDTVLGRGTTVVAHPDGELAAYLDSLERIRTLTGDGSVVTILPGHGPVVPDAGAMVAFYQEHRRERLEQVRAALADGAADEADPVEGVLRRVYAQMPQDVWPAARMSIRAQLDFLTVRDA